MMSTTSVRIVDEGVEVVFKIVVIHSTKFGIVDRGQRGEDGE
jgi:hypothetical protein